MPPIDQQKLKKKQRRNFRGHNGIYPFLLCPTLTKQPAGSDSNCKERQTKKNLVSLGLYPTVGFVLCTFTTLYFELMLQEKFGFFGLSRKVLSEARQACSLERVTFE